MIAALFVNSGGPYFDLPEIDPWDIERDARAYSGPWPIIAHPPCQRWGKMWFGSPNVVAKTGMRKEKGADDGCFAAALNALRAFGGVLEHPWQSHAWPHFKLTVPPREGGWIRADDFDGWTCCVEQGQYGHYARKPTMLLAYRTELPELKWGKNTWEPEPELVARIGIKRAKKLGEVCSKGGGVDSNPRIHTPIEFRNLLITMARSVQTKGYDL